MSTKSKRIKSKRIKSYSTTGIALGLTFGALCIGSGVYGYYRYKNKDRVLFDKVVKYLVNNKKDDTNMDNYITSKKFNAGIFAFLINNIENEIQNEGKKIKGELYDYVNKTRCISNIEECDQENLNMILKKVNIKNLRELYKNALIYDKCMFNYYPLIVRFEIEIS